MLGLYIITLLILLSLIASMNPVLAGFAVAKLATVLSYAIGGMTLMIAFQEIIRK